VRVLEESVQDAVGDGGAQLHAVFDHFEHVGCLLGAEWADVEVVDEQDVDAAQLASGRARRPSARARATSSRSLGPRR